MSFLNRRWHQKGFCDASYSFEHLVKWLTHTLISLSEDFLIGISSYSILGLLLMVKYFQYVWGYYIWSFCYELDLLLYELLQWSSSYPLLGSSSKGRVPTPWSVWVTTFPSKCKGKPWQKRVSATLHFPPWNFYQQPPDLGWLNSYNDSSTSLHASGISKEEPFIWSFTEVYS